MIRQKGGINRSKSPVRQSSTPQPAPLGHPAESELHECTCLQRTGLASRVACEFAASYDNALSSCSAGTLCHHTHIDALFGEIPEHLDELIWQGVQVDVEFAVWVVIIVSVVLIWRHDMISHSSWKEGLTLDIVLSVRLLRFVVMHHLNDLQQIVFWKLWQGLGKLLHVDVAISLGTPLLGLAGRSAIDGIACRARLLESFEQLWLRVAESLQSLVSLFPSECHKQPRPRIRTTV